MKQRPHVVFLFADEWRGQAVGYAGDVNCQTPNIDRFATRAVNFRQAVSGCSVCCPYRASLLTGQYPLRHGVFVNDVELSPDCQSIARAFSAGGYDTAYIGKWHVYGSPDGAYGRRHAYVPRDHQLGFDYWKGYECNHNYNKSHYFYNDDPTPRRWEGYDAFAQSHDAAEYIRAHAGSDKPFLLMVSWGPPHFPLHTAPEAYRRMYENREIVLRPNVPEHLREKAIEELRGYYAHIAAIDDAFAMIHDAIRDAGLDDDTVFVLTADHGDMRQSQGLDTKQYPWDESVVVPFLLRDPRLKPGTTHDAPIDAPDLMPTLLGLCGLPIPGTVQGRDWSPAILGRQPLTADEAAFLNLPAEFSETRHRGIRAYRGLRNARYTYVRNTTGPWLLYDNHADPYQMHNLINDARHADLQTRLEAQLQQRLGQYGDEFLDGRAYIERAGLSHYKEVQAPLVDAWCDPWAERSGDAGAPSGPIN